MGLFSGKKRIDYTVLKSLWEVTDPISGGFYNKGVIVIGVKLSAITGAILRGGRAYHTKKKKTVQNLGLQSQVEVSNGGRLKLSEIRRENGGEEVCSGVQMRRGSEEWKTTGGFRGTPRGAKGNGRG